VASRASTDSAEWGNKAANIVWKALRESFGTSWIDKFGTEPSGAWIEEMGGLKYPQIKGALTKIRNHQVPYPGWVPSLSEFLGFVRGVTVGATVHDPGPQLDAVEITANKVLFSYLLKRNACSSTSLAKMLAAKKLVEEAYRIIITEEEVTKGEFQDKLEIQFNRVYQPASPEEIEGFRDRRFHRSSRTQGMSNSSTPTGPSTQAELLR